MKLSYIIPVYNCAQYLDECIANLEKTGFQDYEIILVDDGSTDESVQICNRLENGNSKIRCIHQINQGVSVARNTGLQNALGEYVLFIDADDLIDIHELSNALNYLIDIPMMDMMIYGLSFDYYYHGDIYRRDVMPPPLSWLLQRAEWLPKCKELFYSNSLSPIWNKVIRKQFLLDNKIWFDKDLIVYEDLLFSLKVLERAEYIFFYPGTVYHYRQSEDEGNAGRRLKKISQLSMVVDKIEVALNELMEGNEIDFGIIEVLTDIYTSLMRAKIGASSRVEIKEVCEEFGNWYSLHVNGSNNNSYIELLLSGNINRIILNHMKTNIRHKIAIRLKSTNLYKKWRKEQWI